MAIAFTEKVYTNEGSVRGFMAKLTLDSSYPTGGYSIAASIFKLKKVFQVVAEPTSGYVFQYDYTNNKLLAYRSAGFTPAGSNSEPTLTVEAAGAIGTSMEVGLSADTAGATFEGGTGITAQRVLTTTSPVGTPTFTGTAVAAAALLEVANAVSLSTIVTRIRAVGA